MGVYSVFDCATHIKLVSKIGSWRGRLIAKMSSLTIKFNVEKFSEKNNFRLWWVKIRVLLVQQELVKALAGMSALTASLSERDKKIILEKAHSTFVLYWGDKVL